MMNSVGSVTPLGPGSRVGRYKILDELGAGGMGVVYRAHDPRADRDVAIKILAPNLARSVEAVRRFEQEARAASAVDHPNILTLYDVGTQEGSPYLVFALLHGNTLRDLLRAPLAPQRVLDYATQFADGLVAAHSKGVVHRDLKPENLFITDAGRLKIIDFGIAKLAPTPAVISPGQGGSPNFPPVQPEDGATIGTVAYMAPEQVRGKKADHRTDIFAFGTILYEMIAGRRAFSGNTPFETGNAILRKEPSPLPSGTARELEFIVRKCLQKSSEKRFESRELLARLMELRTLPPPAEQGGKSRSIVQAAMHTLHGTGLWLAGPSRWKALPVVVAALAVVAAAIWLLRPKPPAAAPLLSFQQITFRIGSVWSGRFAPDGQTVLYSSAW